MNHRPLVFLDIETTGLSALGGGRITEIGALRVENGVVVDRFSQLLDPQCAVPGFITRLTGIRSDMLAGQPTFAEIADRLSGLLNGAIFVAHNVGFDYSFITQEFARSGRRLSMDRLCTVRLSRRLYPAEPRHGLDCVIKRMGLTVADRHRAYDDAEVLWRMFAYEYERNPWELFRCMEKLLQRSRN